MMANGHRRATGVQWWEVGISFAAWITLAIALVMMVGQPSGAAAITAAVCLLVLALELIYGFTIRCGHVLLADTPLVIARPMTIKLPTPSRATARATRLTSAVTAHHPGWSPVRSERPPTLSSWRPAAHPPAENSEVCHVR